MKYFKEIKKIFLAHKIIGTIVIIVILGFGYYGYKKITTTSGETKYTTTLVKKGTIISTITGSGQVSATNQIDIKAKVSGDITWVYVTTGQIVHAGQVIATLDNKSAKDAVTNAEASLVQAKLQFQRDQAAAPIDYQKTIDDLANAKNDLVTEYNDTFNTISNTYLDLPNVTTGMQNILYGFDLSSNRSQWNVDVLTNIFTNELLTKIQTFADKAKTDYKTARDKYDVTLIEYKQTNRTDNQTALEKLLNDSIDTATATAQALQSELNFLGTVVDTANQYDIHISSTITSMQTNARSYLSTINSDLSALLAQKKSLDTIKQTIKTDEQNITLLKVGNNAGDNPISLQIEQNNLIKQEKDLENLKINLGYYTIVAPFDGTISSVTAKIGDTAGTIASIITKEQVAQLSLNEIDATKVSLGQKATLTFDAISDLSLTGTISEIDPVGTVSQGVVSYTIKITFDTQDPRIKPGMTINASIQTDIHQDILYVPSSAVKTNNGENYVLVFNPPLVGGDTNGGTTSLTSPTQVPIQTGISDGTNIEITSGLTEGQQIVSKTTTGTTATTKTTSNTSIFSGSGAGRSTNVAIPH